MTPIMIDELARLLNTEVLHDTVGTHITGISIDNRSVSPGDAFVAFVGTRVDAHSFIDDAFDRGASVAIVTKPVKTAKGPTIQVQDARSSIQSMAIRERRLFHGPVVGVTGSNGKTTTKQMISAVLSETGPNACLYTHGNQNNELGLPLTILQRKPTHRSMVLEMGMRGPGEIAALCNIAVPNIGVLTNIGHSHIERLGSQENIAFAKSELVQSLSQDGFAILNIDDRWSELMQKRTPASVIWYGFSSAADVRATNLRTTDQGMAFEVAAMGEFMTMKIPTFGKHNVKNALAAIAVGRVTGMSMKAIAQGLERMQDVSGRLSILEGMRNITIIDDCYNASPVSMQASLEILKTFPRSGTRVAILGDMYELGDFSEAGHRMVGDEVAIQHIDQLIAIGEQSAWLAEQALHKGTPSVAHFRTIEEAQAKLPEFIKDGSIVLVKASRGMQLEKMVTFLQRSRY